MKLTPGQKSFLRFLIVGVFNTAIGYAVFLVGLRWLGLAPAVANTLGYAVALGFAYVLNKTFVFDNATLSAKSLRRFLVAFAVAFGINQIVLHLGLAAGARPELVQIAAMVCYTVIFYVANRVFVYRP
jgi:putative flippase GtrA